MIEIGVILSNLSKKVESVVNGWLSNQVDIYNRLHDYNINKTALFPNDPIGLKCFVPTAMYSVFPPYATTTKLCEFIDSDTVIFCASPSILNTYTISTETFSDDIIPNSSFYLPYAGRYSDSFSLFSKTSTGYAWVVNPNFSYGSIGVQYTNDNFVTIHEITQYPFPPDPYGHYHALFALSSHPNGDNFIITYPTPETTSGAITDIIYDTVAGTASKGSDIPYNFSTVGHIVKKIGNYILLYHSYGYRSGFFLIDITGTDTYWYYIDPVFLEMYRPSHLVDMWRKSQSSTLDGVHDIKKFGDDLYFVFDVNAATHDFSIRGERVFILCKMETV